MRTLICAVLSLLVCAPLAAQRIDDVPHAVDVVEITPATIEELAATAVTPPIGNHEERQRPKLAATRATGDAVVAELVPVTDAAPAPPVTRGFRSSFDPLPGATIGYDPADASGAVGPRHVVGAFNNSLVVHDRSGNQLSFLSIYQFWHDPAYVDTLLYDPRVIYDADNDRWVLAMLTDANYRLGVLLLAISANGDPTGTWRRFRIPVAQDPSLAGDFTRMAMTADQIVVTFNEWAGDIGYGSDVLTIPKSTAYAASGTPAVTKTKHDLDVGPVNSSDTTVRLVEVIGAGVLVSQLGSINPKVYAPPVRFLLGSYPCGQLGSTITFDCGNLPLQYALFRGGVLWIVHGAIDNGRNVVVVWKISGDTAKGFVLEDPAIDYAFPSIAVNRYGAALVGYSMANSSMYPSAAYRYIDPAGNVSAPMTAKSGEDWYLGFRWGDYSSTLVDPVDDTSFWTLECYMPQAAGLHQKWATWWSYVQVKPPQRVRAVKH